jgi:hypothetical protein
MVVYVRVCSRPHSKRKAQPELEFRRTHMRELHIRAAPEPGPPLEFATLTDCLASTAAPSVAARDAGRSASAGQKRSPCLRVTADSLSSRSDFDERRQGRRMLCYNPL